MTEQIRVRADYGTVSGYTGKWLVEHRFSDSEGWTTCYLAGSEREARNYVDETPEWARMD